MMSSPLVSIISPAYNHERYIADCIRSVQAQTYPHWEMLIVNDGSTDNTSKVAESFASNDPRIKIFSRDNIGIMRLAETYNFALSKSAGKYISILECDDVWEEDKLALQVQALESDERRVVAWGRARSANADLTVITGESPSGTAAEKPFYTNDPPGTFLNLLYRENCITALTITARKDALESVGGFRQSFDLPLVDLPTLLALSLKGTFYFEDKILGTWRTSAMQVTKSFPVEILEGRRKLVFDHYEKLPAEVRSRVKLDTHALDDYFRKKLQVALARSGRYKLVRKDYSGARKDYMRSLGMNGFSQPAWKLRAMIGIVMSLLHTDVEWMARLAGRTTYKSK